MTSSSLSMVSKTGSPLVALDQPGDVLVRDRAADLARDDVDELLPGQDAGDVLVVEDPLGTPGRPSAAPVMTTGSISRWCRHRRAAEAIGRALAAAAAVSAEDMAAAVDEIRDQVAKFGVTVSGHGCSHGCGCRAGCRECLSRLGHRGSGVRCQRYRCWCRRCLGRRWCGVVAGMRSSPVLAPGPRR